MTNNHCHRYQFQFSIDRWVSCSFSISAWNRTNAGSIPDTNFTYSVFHAGRPVHGNCPTTQLPVPLPCDLLGRTDTLYCSSSQQCAKMPTASLLTPKGPIGRRKERHHHYKWRIEPSFRFFFHKFVRTDTAMTVWPTSFARTLKTHTWSVDLCTYVCIILVSVHALQRKHIISR